MKGTDSLEEGLMPADWVLLIERLSIGHKSLEL